MQEDNTISQNASTFASVTARTSKREHFSKKHPAMAVKSFRAYPTYRISAIRPVLGKNILSTMTTFQILLLVTFLDLLSNIAEILYHTP